MQSKKESLLESITNNIVGYSVNFFMNLLILPIFGFNPSLSQNAKIGLLFTGVSLVRSYVLRRIYNKIGMREDGKESNS